MVSKVLIRLSLLFYLYVHAHCSECRDQNNRTVDWFLAYKLPNKQGSKADQNMKDGLAYIYMTSTDKHWKYSNVSMNATESIIGNTLNVLYQARQNVSYIVYNDENPNGKTSSTKGHTKGVVTVGKDGGYWLVHSVPKFPDLSGNYSYPKTGSMYGQSFLCVSMNLENLNKVGIQLQYNEPNVYAASILPDIQSVVPNLTSAAANVTVKSSPWYNLMTLSSKQNAQFLSFAKSKKFNKELYVDLVAPYLSSDLDTETWQKGTGKLTSNCTRKFHVNNIKYIHMEVAKNMSFSSLNDHSKWAVSAVKSQKSWTCIGDINRAEHQRVRGGGTVCLDDKQVSSQYQKLIQTLENC